MRHMIQASALNSKYLSWRLFQSKPSMSHDFRTKKNFSNTQQLKKERNIQFSILILNKYVEIKSKKK